MPELPDVETFRRYFNATSLHNRIADLEVRNARVLENISESEMKKALAKRAFESTSRLGKYLFAIMDDGRSLLFHFGMTGYLKYYKEERNLDHERVTLHFENGYHLAYVCQRMLGKMTVVDRIEGYAAEHNIGPDALSVDRSWFKDHFSNKRGALKPALMDQTMLAGLGNIYTDEVLFQAGFHPGQPVKKLDGDDLNRLFEQMKQVLETAVENKADPALLPDSFFLPNRDTSTLCPKCGGKIRRTKISGRTAYFCPRHQKMK
jgi:formamidopyrimidine-DNA glycosylase